MRNARYVVLGLARPGRRWLSAVGRWAAAAALPVEFLPCPSSSELLTRVDSGRVFSAALLDGDLPAVDRDLLAALREAGITPLVVRGTRPERDWTGLGTVAVLSATFAPEDLLTTLAAHASMIDEGLARSVPAGQVRTSFVVPGRVAAVCGTGGSGASTAASALAQGLMADGRYGRPVLLADFCRRAEQGLLHHARAPLPGVLELLEAHRHGLPSDEQVLGLTAPVARRGYRLLLGLRAPHHWTMVRPRSLAAAVASLRHVFPVAVFDTDGDFESEEEAGSVDVEERNLLARHPTQRADVVFVVGRPGMKGLHSLARALGDVRRLGVDVDRIVPVVNLAPSAPQARADITQALGRLLAEAGTGPAPRPLFLPECQVEAAFQAGQALPAPLPALLVDAFAVTLQRTRAGLHLPARPVPEPVRPGALGVPGVEGRHA